MPRLTATEARPEQKVRVIFSVPLDLLNAMYFTHLAGNSEGVEGWPVQVRREMAPDLLAELDSLYNFPVGEPGLMGLAGDAVWAHPEAWDSVDSLVRHIRTLPLGIGESQANAGIQGLILRALNPCDGPIQWQPGDDPEEALRGALQPESLPAALELYHNPEQVRERMAHLTERFWEEHYRAELPNRREALERSAAAHQGMTEDEAPAMIKQVSGRDEVCFQSGTCPGPFEQLLFAPSIDMGPYMSCIIIDTPRPMHAMFYPCEERFKSNTGDDTGGVVQMARIYKALSDEQRLRILGILQEREMYSQEIVERTGLHQSVVSRHLSFLRAVGLLKARKEGNMKHFSINTEARDRLSATLDLFQPRVQKN